MRLITLLLLSALLAASPSRADRPLPRYSITDLGAIPGFPSFGNVTAINDKGQVVGSRGHHGHAFLWERGKMTDLGTLPLNPLDDPVDTDSDAYAINNQGQIVGSSGGDRPVVMSGLSTETAFLYSDGKMRSLDGRINGASFIAYGINDRGQVVGQDGYRGFVWTGGKLITLGTLSKLPQGNSSEAYAINNHGQVVGQTTAPAPGRSPIILHAFLWQRNRVTSKMRDLGTLPEYLFSDAAAINDRGEVVGAASNNPHAYDGLSSSHALLWRRGRMIDLGTLPGDRTSHANGINNHSQIVGQSGTRAFVWQFGRMADLNDLIPPGSGWRLTEATAINNRGQIVGTGEMGGQRHGFLLTPQ